MPKSSLLAGLIVVDESRGPAGGLATMALADFGARVIKIEPAQGDPWRATASAPLWLRGKLSLAGYASDSRHRGRLLALARKAQVWVRGPDLDSRAVGDTGETAGNARQAVQQDVPADTSRQASLCDEELQAANPRLVIAWVTAFGRIGEFASCPAYESLVAARVGRMLNFRGLPARPGPAYAALQVATHAASQSLLSGVLAALHAVARDGQGQVIETSLMRALLAYEMGQLLTVQVDAMLRARGEPGLPPMPDPATALPTLNYHPSRVRTGW